MSYVVGLKNSTYANPGTLYGQIDEGDWRAPIPGWGMNPNWAGPKMVGIGADSTAEIYKQTAEVYQQAAKDYESAAFIRRMTMLLFGGVLTAAIIYDVKRGAKWTKAFRGKGR
jgi:hypothetical protein